MKLALLPLAAAIALTLSACQPDEPATPDPVPPPIEETAPPADTTMPEDMSTPPPTK